MFRSEVQPLYARRSVYHRGTVACPKCGTPIHVYRPATVAEEFSVACKTCGTRAIHGKRALKVEELPERRRKPRG
jgi:hypothetical protein